MNWKRNQSARAAALQVSVFVALMAISAGLFATSFMAGVAPSERPIRLAQFYPPLPKAALPTTPESTVAVSAPVFTMDTSDGFAVNNQAVTTTTITPSVDGGGNCTNNATCYIGFEAYFRFDSAVALPSPTVAPVIPAGLTASGWTVSGNVMNTGPGTLKTLHISAFVNDGVTPLSGAGTLFLIHWKRVSTNPGDSTSLTWSASPNDFEFYDTDLNAFSPTQNNGLITITITSGGTPAPTLTPTPTSTPPLPTPSPTPPLPTPTPTPPLPTPSPVPGLKVSAPIFAMGTSDGFVVNDQPVTTTTITPSVDGGGNCTNNATCYIGFLGDIIFDSAVALPSPTVAPVAPAGLTAIGWTVSGVVINSGPGTLKTLRVSAFSNDGVTPLSGAGALFRIHWKRVSTNAGDSTLLTWGVSENFRFVDTNLDYVSVSQNNGLITITAGGTPAPTPTPTQPPPTPTPTQSPTPPLPTPTPTPPLPTPTPGPGLKVSAPVFTMGTSDGFAVNDQPVTTTFVSASLDYIGFQGDLVFDSAVAIPSPTVAPVIPAGLTASGWTVSGIILNSGPGTLKTLRISGFSNDGVTPLSGAGTLLLINWKRVSTNPGDSTSLTWQPYPNDFEYIDLNLDAISPSQNNGLITIATGGTPAPTPTPLPPTPSPTPPLPTPSPTATPTPTPPQPTPTPTASPTPPGPTGTPGPACVFVTATAGVLGPTGYSTMKAAFDAINAGTHRGAIDISINCDVVETASAVLNASGTGSASYGSVLIYPVGARTVSGSLAGPLIYLDGADNVTIDGGNEGGQSLTFSNTNTGAAPFTSTIRLNNGAQNNLITNCSILGSSTGSIDSGTANVLIGTSGGGANSGNTISNNDLGPAGSNLPSQCVMSTGSPNNNVSNVITNNNVFDFFTPDATSAGINISFGNDLTTISNNRIYQTAPRVFTTPNLTYYGIFVDQSLFGGSITITGNRIGFGAADGTGTTTISGLNNRINGIAVPHIGSTIASSIQNNTISGFNQTTSQGGTTATSSFVGISVGAAGVGVFDIGGVTGNTVGSLDGSSGIVINNTTTAAHSWGFAGIVNSSGQGPQVINNNNIGTITINDGGSGTGAGFRGIHLTGSSGQSATINNNVIGGPAANSITDNVVGDYEMYGINHWSSNLTCTGNIVRNFSGNARTPSSTTSTLSGIITAIPASGVSTISWNTIHSLTDNGSSSLAVIYGMYCYFPSTANIVEGNVIHSLNVIGTGDAREVAGIHVRGGSATFKNNMVRLGLDSTGASITDGYPIEGIIDTSGTSEYYFNSVYIGGSGVVSSQSTYAFVSYTSASRIFINNIFDNSRSNASGSARNYAIWIAGTAQPNPPGLTCNYNDLYAPGNGGRVGKYNNNEQATLAAWRTATGVDAASISANPQFLDPTADLHLRGDSPCIVAGTSIAGINTDIDNEVRNPIAPTIGADEYTGPTPTPSPTPPPSPSPTPSPTPTSSPTPSPSPTPPIPTPTTTPALTPCPGSSGIRVQSRFRTAERVHCIRRTSPSRESAARS